MTRRGTLHDPETHELIARIEHGGITTSRDANEQLFHRAEFYVLQQIRSFLPLPEGGLVWAHLAGGLEGLAVVSNVHAEPVRLIQGRLRSSGNWAPAPVLVAVPQPDEAIKGRPSRRHHAARPGLRGTLKDGLAALPTPGRYLRRRVPRTGAATAHSG